MVRLTLLTTALLVGSTNGFAPSTFGQATKSASPLTMTTNDVEADSRRSFLSRVAGSAAIAGLSFTQAIAPAQALGGGGLKKVNARLQAYGLQTIDKLPDGFSPLLEIWGKGKNRDPLLVQFNHPLDWVVTLPSQDINGEDGTIQAGEYAKGDTATFFVYTDEGLVSNIAEQPKDFFQRAVIKAISQKGDNLYQNFKVTKITPKTESGQEYMIVDFKYQLLTGAGFEVDRKGVASVTSVGKAVEVLWTASTAIRYKKTEESLRNIADSFRCYADGLELQKIAYETDDY